MSSRTYLVLWLWCVSETWKHCGSQLHGEKLRVDPDRFGACATLHLGGCLTASCGDFLDCVSNVPNTGCSNSQLDCQSDVVANCTAQFVVREHVANVAAFLHCRSQQRDVRQSTQLRSMAFLEQASTNRKVSHHQHSLSSLSTAELLRRLQQRGGLHVHRHYSRKGIPGLGGALGGSVSVGGSVSGSLPSGSASVSASASASASLPALPAASALVSASAKLRGNAAVPSSAVGVSAKPKETSMDKAKTLAKKGGAMAVTALKKGLQSTFPGFHKSGKLNAAKMKPLLEKNTDGARADFVPFDAKFALPDFEACVGCLFVWQRLREDAADDPFVYVTNDIDGIRTKFGVLCGPSMPEVFTGVCEEMASQEDLLIAKLLTNMTAVGLCGSAGYCWPELFEPTKTGPMPNNNALARLRRGNTQLASINIVASKEPRYPP